MAHPRRQRDALQVIFAFFLGLMVAAFIGMGVYTFYPSPVEELHERISDLRQDERDLRGRQADVELSEAQREQIESIEAELEELEELRRERQERWSRNTSIVLVLLSTLVMSVSLVRADQLPVISNGLLLGGVFTMLYGTGWTLFSGHSQLRFWVMAFALVVTLGLGWLRFVRGASRGWRPTAQVPVEMASLQQRVADLERRVDAAGEAFRGGTD